MKPITIRILHSSSVGKAEIEAASKGAKRFERIGIFHDCANVRKGYTAIRSVRSGREIRGLILSPEPDVDPESLSVGIMEVFREKSVIPVGLTGSTLHRIVPDGLSVVLEPRVGFAVENRGAIVSLTQIRELGATETGGAESCFLIGTDRTLSLKATEIAVAHELGHVFGISDHCEDIGCAMHEDGNGCMHEFFTQRMERLVKQELDFCKKCWDLIAKHSKRLMHGQ